MEYKFLVARNDIKGEPGLEKGDLVIRKAVEQFPGGYEYDVWHCLETGLTARTRIEHRGEFIECSVDGYDMDECMQKAIEVSDGMRSSNRNE